MAFNIDYMANPAYGYEDEETRRRREEEERRRQQEALTQQSIQALQPIAPQDLNQYLAQNESGSNPNIGYHFQPDASGNRRSTAYGKYGITTNAYKDIQQRDPYFQNRSIESLSIEDQDRAQNVYNGALTQQLQAYGVEATPGNIAAADFLGAKGFSDYLKTGTISNAAAQANGGADRVRQIVEQRRRFGNAPASGAAVEQGQGAPVSPDQLQQRTQQEQQAQVDQQLLGQGIKLPGVTPQPTVTPSTSAIESYQKNQDDPAALLSLRNDENLPSWIRERAGSRAYELLDMERKRTQAEQDMQMKVQAAMAGDPKASRQVANELSSKVATFGKMILAGFISPALAREYAEELGFGNKSQVVRDEKGNVGLITVSASGKPVDGYLADGTKMNTEQLLKFAAGASGQLDIVGGTYVNDRTGEVGRVVTDKKTGTSYIQTDTGRKPMTGFRPQSSMGTLADQRARQLQELNLRLQGKTQEEKMAILRPYNQQLVAEGYPPISPLEVGITAPQIAGGVAAPAAAPAAAPGVRPTGTQLEAVKQRSESLVKILDEEVRPQAQAGDTVSSTRKQQFEIFKRPGIDMAKIFGMATGAGRAPGDQSWTIIRDVLSGSIAKNADGSAMTPEQMSARLAALNLTPAEQSAIAEYNIANGKINAASLKETAGPGSVSNAEQQLNRERNVDITKIPALGAYNAMAQSQFDGDRARYKADWASTREFRSGLELDREWRKESKRLTDMYTDMARKRLDFVSANGNTPNAVAEGYRRFPVPEYDPNTGTWKKTKPLGEILGR